MEKGINEQTITFGGLGCGCMGKIKTSFSVDEELWKDFNITVIQKEGGRNLSRIIEVLIKRYIDENKEGKRWEKT